MSDVLILTHAGDFYVPDVVAAAVEARGKSVTRIDTDRFPADATLMTTSDGRCVFSVDVDDVEIDLVRVHAVWCRRLYAGVAPIDVDDRYAQACREQARTAFDDALVFMEDAGARFVNDLAAQRRADSARTSQLRHAHGVGFDVPPTIVTNDPLEARAFIARNEGDVVAKLLTPLSQSMQPSADAPFVYTTAVDAGDVADLDALRCAPMIFQRRVRKTRDVRIVVVGARVFAASLASTTLDWRRPGTTGTWTAASLPADVEHRCVAIVRMLGLVFGAIDVVVDEHERHWFLEVNPAGEWGWLQRDCGHDVAGAIADELVRA